MKNKNLLVNNPYTDVSMTSLQGYITASLQELENRLGTIMEIDPNDGDGKVLGEWTLEEKTLGVVARIYCWKTDSIPTNTNYRWHIGGHSQKAVALVGLATGIPVEGA
jgi:hypothetical protein